jgi:hypothetical protein
MSTESSFSLHVCPDDTGSDKVIGFVASMNAPRPFLANGATTAETAGTTAAIAVDEVADLRARRGLATASAGKTVSTGPGIAVG